MDTANEVKYWKSFFSFTILQNKNLSTTWILEDIFTTNIFHLKACVFGNNSTVELWLSSFQKVYILLGVKDHSENQGGICSSDA